MNDLDSTDLVVVSEDTEVYKVSEENQSYVDEYSESQKELLREETRKLSEAGDAAYITMAGNLHTIRRGKLYKGWGHDRFGDYIEIELGVSLRKAEYLVQIWDYYVEKIGGGSKRILDQVKSLGLTKLKECINVITEDNALKVMDKVQGLSVRKVAEIRKEIAICDHLDKPADDQTALQDSDEYDDIKSDIQHRMSFKLYPDQFKSVADALDLAGSIGNSKCKNTQLRYVSEEFLSTHASDSVEDIKVDACAKFEKKYGVLIMAVDAVDGTILYGDDLEEKLAQLTGSDEEEDDSTAD